MLRNPRLRRSIERSGGLREFLDYDGLVYLDSGGYQLMTKSIDIDVDDIRRLYSDVEADWYFSLDYPIFPNDTPEAMRKKVRKSIQNFSALSRSFDRIIPIVHPSVERAVRMYLRYCELMTLSNVSIGGLVPLILTRRGTQDSRKLAIQLIYRIRRMHAESLHVLGLGSPSLIPALKVLKVDTTDSSSWRISAAFGMVVIPLKGQRHLGSRRIVFGRYYLTEAERSSVEQMRCPVLNEFGWDEVAESFRVRALFNAWMILHQAAVSLPNGGAPLNLMHRYAIELSGKDQ